MHKLIMNKKVINIINETKDLSYNLDVNDFLIINYFCENAKNFNIDIVQNNNSKVIINLLAVVKEDVNINVKCLLKGNDNNCQINVRLIAQANKGKVSAIVKANENTSGNYICEELKGLNENGTVLLEPILEIDTEEVDASHFATVGGFDKKQVFYLQSLGLSLQSVYQLLKQSFVNSLFDSEFLKLLNGGKGKDE